MFLMGCLLYRPQRYKKLCRQANLPHFFQNDIGQYIYEILNLHTILLLVSNKRRTFAG